MNKTLKQAVKHQNVKRSFLSLGLIGYPLGHSLSPQIHNAALQTLNLEGEYRLYPIPPLPEGKTELTNLLNQVRGGTIHGLNVTIPHKQNVIPLLDDLTPAAKAIGAVNTIFCEGDLLIGDNTDAPGFWADLQRRAWSKPFDSAQGKDRGADKHALILGAGGSARAVAYALLTNGYAITIAARRIEQAQALSDRLTVSSELISVVDLKNCPLSTAHCSLIVNTTPVGMHPHIDASPWPEGIPFPDRAAVYDLVYNPHETLLVCQAQAAGLVAMTGLGMLVEQAALAFERWTGFEAPREEMMEAVEGSL